MPKKLKVGLIGMGGIAHTHVPGWQASPYTELAAGCDIDPAVFPLWKEQHGLTRVYDNNLDLIKNREIDIIDIGTPHMFHSEMAVAALLAGKHVICEKPLAPTPDGIRKMIDARKKSGKLLMTAQHQRFRQVSAAMKAEIDGGILGEVYHGRAWCLRRSLVPISPTFIYKERSGGGPCIDIGVHVLDMALWLMGFPKPAAVSGVAKAPLLHQKGAFSTWGNVLVPEDIDVEDFSAAFIRFENGATLILEVSWMLHHNMPSEDIRLWLYGTRGGCEWPAAAFVSASNERRQLYSTILEVTGDSMEAHALECVEFARAVVEGLPSPVPAEQSLYVQAILDGVYRSQEEGREVKVIL